MPSSITREEIEQKMDELALELLRNPPPRNPRKDLQIYRNYPHLTDGSDRRWYIISALQLRRGLLEHFESIGKTPVVVNGVALG